MRTPDNTQGSTPEGEVEQSPRNEVVLRPVVAKKAGRWLRQQTQATLVQIQQTAPLLNKFVPPGEADYGKIVDDMGHFIIGLEYANEVRVVEEPKFLFTYQFGGMPEHIPAGQDTIDEERVQLTEQERLAILGGIAQYINNPLQCISLQAEVAQPESTIEEKTALQTCVENVGKFANSLDPLTRTRTNVSFSIEGGIAKVSTILPPSAPSK